MKTGQRLEIEYERIDPSDKTGMVNISASGFNSWHYACVGTHHGMQGERDGHDERVMEFGAKLAKLVREHFGEVAPIMATPVGHVREKRGRR